MRGLLAAIFLIFVHSHISRAEELRLIGSPGVRSVVSDLGQRFEAATSHKLIADFEVFAGLKRRIDAGEAFDIAVLSPALIDDYIKQRRIIADTRTDFGRGGMGIGIRKGAARPDVGSVESLRRTMLDAKSVAYSKEGQSGVHFLSLLGRLGITQDMQSRIQPHSGPALTAAVASGAELVVTSITVIIPAPGVELAGELPPEVQSYVGFTGGISASTTKAQTARAFMQFVTTPAAAPVFRTHGLRLD
jgi:molybdate transport system substrate-binding protein